jgi:hypothetical protein
MAFVISLEEYHARDSVKPHVPDAVQRAAVHR